MSDGSGIPEEENPYADHLSGPEPDTKSNAQDQSVFGEPWMRKEQFDGDEYSDGQVSRPDPTDVEHTVWDEPGLSPQLAGDAPDDALTWSAWYLKQQAQTSLTDTWLVTVLLALLAAPLALVTAWFRFGGSTFDLVAILIVIPATEELLKVALPLWVVEKRPHLFCAPFQILLCSACSGFLFGAMRHVIAVQLFVPSSGMLRRTTGGDLTGSIVMHTVCSLIAGLALVRIWSIASKQHQRPDLTAGSTFGAIAIGLHIISVSIFLFV